MEGFILSKIFINLKVLNLGAVVKPTVFMLIEIIMVLGACPLRIRIGESLCYLCNTVS